VPLAVQTPRARAGGGFDERLDDYEGWAKYNRHYWLEHYRDFLEFFFSHVFIEPHSTKQIEDCVGWGLETTPETLVATQLAPHLDEAATRELAGRLRCPVPVIHGPDDATGDELRALHPDLEIDWLAQHPVTAVLEARSERIHPASAYLANESHHIESESAEHDLHCFQAWRRMDEILLTNFMIFHDLVREEQYDVWISDEAWELDYYLHENPEQKRAAYAWLTDFVGWLPMPDGGDHEAFLTGDYNEEMIEHIAGAPRVRHQA